MSQVRDQRLHAGRLTGALKLRPAGAGDKRDGLHWAFRQKRRQRADSFKRRLGCSASS
jgi:hypothetical protein